MNHRFQSTGPAAGPKWRFRNPMQARHATPTQRPRATLNATESRAVPNPSIEALSRFKTSFAMKLTFSGISMIATSTPAETNKICSASMMCVSDRTDRDEARLADTLASQNPALPGRYRPPQASDCVFRPSDQEIDTPKPICIAFLHKIIRPRGRRNQAPANSPSCQLTKRWESIKDPKSALTSSHSSHAAVTAAKTSLRYRNSLTLRRLAGEVSTIEWSMGWVAPSQPPRNRG